MNRSWIDRPLVREFAAAALIVGTAVAWRVGSGGAAADATPPSVPATAAKPVALINGAEITADRLAAECLGRHGVSVLETIVNRRLIEQACHRQGLRVTPQDVEAEIDAMATRFSVPREKWIEMIQQERGIAPRQYAEDIVWPMIALRRLAQGSIEPTDDELLEAFEKQYGPAVKARIIVSRTRDDAERLRRRALDAPDDFAALARQHSIDVASASANGWVQPIRLHSGEPHFDRAAFALEPGGVSEVVQVADQFIIVKCEGHLPAADVKLDAVRPQLAETIRERKSRQASNDVFRRLQTGAVIVNVMNDAARAAASPGVAALVNGEPIPLADVRAACVDRHGGDVLEILITKTLIAQELERQHQSVSQADLDAEVGRAAVAMGFQTPAGQPDTAAWLERVTREEKVPLRHYVDDVVWPTVALKRLVGTVPVTQDDLERAYAATFGARARCRIIVLDSQRKAQEVWQLARQNPTPEHVGTLAETYSADPTTRTLRGEVPPIQRWGGQPTLEREVFALKPGELSGVVQVADRFMVILCEGFTEPVQVEMSEVRDELHADILDKKQRIEMTRYFAHLREGAAIDNFLAGTSQSPAGKLPAAGLAPQTGPSKLSRAEAAELARPRAGSRQAPPPAPGSGVVPAGFTAPAR